MPEDMSMKRQIVESDEFLTPEESAALLNSLAQPTPGTCLEQFIWEYADGNVKEFATKVGYHPNRISALKSASSGISIRLFRRMTEAYKLAKKEHEFWSRRLFGT